MPAAFAARKALIFVLFALGAAACAPEEEASVEDGAAAMTTEEATPKLTAKYGVRPRRYEGYLNSSNESEQEFSLALREATTFLRDRLAERKADFTIDEAELATNILSEGLGYFVLEPNQVDGISGFGSLGIDTLVDALPAYKPWLHPDVLAHVRPENIEKQTNEKKEQVQSLQNLSVRLGVLANAGMYAWFKSRVAQDLAASGKRLSSLPRPGQVFWSTLYFNSGAGTGKTTLAQNGVDYYRQKWTRADDFERYGRVPQFNALWRTASYEMLAQTVFAGGERQLPEPRPYEKSGSRREYPIALQQEGSRWVGELKVEDFGKLDQGFLLVDVDRTMTASIPVTLTSDRLPLEGFNLLEVIDEGQLGLAMMLDQLGATRTWKVSVALPPEAHPETMKLVFNFR